MGCIVLVLLAVVIPAGVGTFLVSAHGVEWGWGLVGALLASVSLTNWMGGSVLSDQEWSSIVAQVGDNSGVSFLGKWLAALAYPCTAFLPMVGLVGGIGAGAWAADQQRHRSP